MPKEAASAGVGAAAVVAAPRPAEPPASIPQPTASQPRFAPVASPHVPAPTAAAPAPAVAPAPSAPYAPPPPAPSQSPIVPAPVVQIAEPAQPHPRVQSCARCQGQNDHLARFCKYCGNALAGPPGASHTAAPIAAPVPVAAPAPVVPVPVPTAPIAIAPAPPQVALQAPPAQPAPQPAPILAPIAGSVPRSPTSDKTGPHPLVKPGEIAAKLRAHVGQGDARVGAQAEALGVPAGLLGGHAPASDTVQTRAPEHHVIVPEADPIHDAPAISARPGMGSPLGAAGSAPAAHVASDRARARLVVVVEDGSDGKAFDLVGPEVIVGRSEGDVLLFDDPYVSPRHAAIVERQGKWSVVDLKSTNGVYLRVRGRKPVDNGDLILLGSQVVQFQLVSDEERQLSAAVQHGTRIFGSKPAVRHARLDQRTVAGLIGDVHYIFREETVLGRETGDIVFTSDAFLSRRHAILRREPASGRFHIEDLDSSNGTYLAIKSETALATGDKIRVGQHLFRFESRP